MRSCKFSTARAREREGGWNGGFRGGGMGGRLQPPLSL